MTTTSTSPRVWSQVRLVDAVREETVSPEAAALLVARDARPELDIAAQLTALDELAAPLGELDPDADPPAQAASLAAHLHETLGFHGNAAAYYDARNSYLDEVVRRRTGIPITLSIVYAAIGRRVGITVDGIGFPGHFLARVGGPAGVLIDPFDGGRIVDDAALERLAARALGDPEKMRDSHLAPVGLRALVVRMLLNLKHVHERNGEYALALVACDRLVDLTDDIRFRRDRGLHALALGATAQAHDDLTAYLEGGGDDEPDAAAVRLALRDAVESGDGTLS